MGNPSQGSDDDSKAFGGSHGQDPQPEAPDVDYDRWHRAAEENDLGLQDHVITADEARRNAQLRAHLPPPLGQLLAGPGPDDMSDPKVKQLAKDQEYKLDAPAPPQIDYMAIPHADLKKTVQHTADPGQLDSAGQAWTTAGNHAVDLQRDIAKGIAASEDGWRGDAADQARDAVANLSRSASGIANGSHLAGSVLGQQSTALSTARAHTPDPPADPYDPDKAAAHLQTLKDDPVAYHHQMQAYRVQQHQEHELHKQAAQAIQTYDQTTTHMAHNQPAFAPPPPGTGGTGGGGGGDVGGGFSGTEGHGATPYSYTGGTGGTPGDHQGNTGDAGGRNSRIPGGGKTDTGGSDTTNTDPSDTGHGRRGHIPHLPGGPGGPGGPGDTNWGDGRGRGRGGEPVPGPIPGGGGGTGTGGGTGSGTGRGGRYGGGRGAGTGAGSGAGAGTEGGRAGAGRSGAGRAGALGEGGKAGSGTGESGRTGAGGRSGAGRAGAGAAEEAAMGRGGAGGGAATGRGGRGMGMMPRGGKGGKGEDDYEHNSPSWLIEPDKDTLFGCDQKTAPPVIGNWWGQHDPRKNSDNTDDD